MKLPVLPFFLLLLIPPVTHAAESTISLREAIDLALANDHLLRAASHRKTATAEGIAVTRSRYFPRIQFEEEATVTNSPTRVFMFKLDEGRFALRGDLNHPRAVGDFRSLLSLQQPLLDFSLGHGVESAEAEDRGQTFALKRQREQTAFFVFGAYLDVQQAKSFLRLTEQAVLDATEHLRLATVRSGTGVGLKADELRARTYLAEREMDRTTATNDLRLAQLRLARAVGREFGSLVDIGEELPPTEASVSREELLTQALAGRSDLMEAAAGADRAESDVRAARATYLPTLYGSATYQMNDRDIPFGRDNDAWGAGVVLRWELFDGLRRRHEVERARAEKGVAAERFEQRRSEIALEVEESYLRRQEAAQRLGIARRALFDAQETVRLVAKRFENSLAAMVDVIDAQTALDRSRGALASAEIATVRTLARLNHAAGVFLREVKK